MRYLFSALFIVSIGAIAQQPNQPDSCKDVLRDGVFNQTNAASSETMSRAMYAQLCASSYEEAKNLIQASNSGSGGVKVGIGYDSFGFDFGGTHSNSGSFTQSQFDAWQQSSCHTTDSKNASSAANYLMQRIASDAVIEAWSQCMANNKGLSCWASPYGSQDALVTLSWRQQSATKLVVTMTDLSGATSRYDNVPKGKLLPQKITLDPGSIQVPITRRADKSVLVTVNANHAGENFQCSAFIPSDDDFKLQKVVAAVNPQQIVQSPDLGCDVKAMDSPCVSSWSSTGPANYKICSASLQYTAGPTGGASMAISRVSSNSVSVRWTVVPVNLPFGPGRWVHAVAKVVYVETNKNADDNGNACN